MTKNLIIGKDCETQYKNVFAGGDATRGADSLINAIGDGKNAAISIMKRVNNKSNLDFTEPEEKLTQAEFQKKQAFRKYGSKMPEIGLDERDNFNLVHPNLTDAAAIAEAQRCLYCSDICNICIGVCPNFANVSFQADKVSIPIYTINVNGSIHKTITNYLNIDQTNQIFNIGDFCNECGNCNTFCPTNGAPYITKPKFYLTEESFGAEDNCYFIGKDFIKYKSNGSIQIISCSGDSYNYKSNGIEATFDEINFEIVDIKVSDKNISKFNLDKAAEMMYLLSNLNEFSIFSHKNEIK